VRERILRHVGDQDDDEKVREAEGAGLPLHDEPHDEEQREVHD